VEVKLPHLEMIGMILLILIRRLLVRMMEIVVMRRVPMAISGAEYVTRSPQFQDVDMEDPHLEVGMSFDSVGQFRKANKKFV